jgi:hypothetical protein
LLEQQKLFAVDGTILPIHAEVVCGHTPPFAKNQDSVDQDG